MAKRNVATSALPATEGGRSTAHGPPPHSRDMSGLQGNLLGLQQAVGNRTLQDLLSAGLLHPKLRIGPPDDPFEREADRMAEAVVSASEPRAEGEASSASAAPGGSVQRLCKECQEEEEETVRPKALPGSCPEAAAEEGIEALRGGGRPLSPELRSFFEPRFGEDLSSVRVHTGAAAGEAPPPVQCEPAISSPGDPYEREADDAANKVMRMAEVAAVGSVIQTKRALSANPEATVHVQDAVHVAEHGGAPMPRDVRGFFETRFRHDFSRVRVHTGGEAANAARAIQARAYTVGRDIVFGSGEYAPATTEGQRLLAHELTHVVQQSGGTSLRFGESSPYIARKPKPPEKADDAAEGEELPAKDTMAGSLVTRIVISLARKRVGFQTAVGMILGDVDTDLKPGTYELKPEPDKQRWVITKPETKSGFRFNVTLEDANPWTLKYPEKLTLDVQAGSLKEPKTFGEMVGDKGLIDPLWIYEGTKPNPIEGPDDFESARYDLDYRSEKGNLSKWLVVEYRDNTKKDINLDTITESTPRLWAAKQEALKVMGEYNLNFLIGTFGTVFFIITIAPTVGIPNRFFATRRAVPKTAGAKPPEAKTPEVKTPEVKAPEVKTPEVKAPEVKAPGSPETKTPATSKTPEPPKAGGTAVVKDPAQFGRDLGAKVRSLPSGKRAAIAKSVSDANLSQADAAKATGEASKEAFGRIAEVPMPDGDMVIASVQRGPNQPIFVVKPNGKVIMARATIEPTVPPNLDRPITITNITPE